MAANDDKEAEEIFKEEEEDHFSRLPDDVVIHLFNTLADAESLCKCSLVSKRCASLIPLIDTLSLSLAASDSNQFLSLNFLQKLNGIRYLRIDLPSHILAGGEGFKWGANFGAGLESVTVLHATSLCQAIEFESEADEIQNGMGIITKSSSDHFPILCLREALLREATLAQFVSYHPTLESIVVTDSTESAVRLFLTGNRLVE
ncbi:F-box protein AUF2-like [Diospyros lotus]|uniref:F-box protein AUF2-like n=1 Tax=Diospyros lotus TaxID=55363 RepID=UPI00225814E5|nr:F-box protein AUF2-like [Diospyros lotus]